MAPTTKAPAGLSMAFSKAAKPPPLAALIARHFQVGSLSMRLIAFAATIATAKAVKL